ncbi:MAG TPA: DUF1559 domain-containing protein [Pirellulales bacterium]|nr:DUF1559 domain-containing protein [Pirellulales bacterium]
MQPTDPHRPARSGRSLAERSRRDLFRQARHAFTLLELLFVVAIIGILISLLLPAIQASREAARRHSCANNLCQLAIATQNYAAVHRVFPPGTIEASGPIQSRPVGYHVGWVAQILPFIEQATVFDQIDFSVGAYDPKNAAMRRLDLAVLRCSSDWGRVLPRNAAGCNYAACHHDVEAPINVDNHGVMFLNSVVGWDDLPDGRAQTIVLGEKLEQGFSLGWISGTRSTLRNMGTPINCTSAPGGPLAVAVDLGVAVWPKVARERPGQPGAADDVRPAWRFQGDEAFASEPEHEYQPPPLADGTAGALVVGGFESRHARGAQFAFGDGSVRFLSQDVDFTTYRRMGHRADGELIDDRF